MVGICVVLPTTVTVRPCTLDAFQPVTAPMYVTQTAPSTLKLPEAPVFVIAMIVAPAAQPVGGGGGGPVSTGPVSGEDGASTVGLASAGGAPSGRGLASTGDVESVKGGVGESPRLGASAVTIASTPGGGGEDESGPGGAPASPEITGPSAVPESGVSLVGSPTSAAHAPIHAEATTGPTVMAIRATHRELDMLPESHEARACGSRFGYIVRPRRSPRRMRLHRA